MLVVVAVFAVNEHATGFLQTGASSTSRHSGSSRSPDGSAVACGVRRCCSPAEPLRPSRSLRRCRTATRGRSSGRWSRLSRGSSSSGGNPSGAPFSGREAMFGFVAVAVVAAAFVPRPRGGRSSRLLRRWSRFTSSLTWARARDGARSVDATAFASDERRDWVDSVLPTDRRALPSTSRARVARMLTPARCA